MYWDLYWIVLETIGNANVAVSLMRGRSIVFAPDVVVLVSSSFLLNRSPMLWWFQNFLIRIIENFRYFLSSTKIIVKWTKLPQILNRWALSCLWFILRGRSWKSLKVMILFLILFNISMPISFLEQKQTQNIKIFKFNNILCYFIEYSHPPSQKIDFTRSLRRSRTTMMNNSTSGGRMIFSFWTTKKSFKRRDHNISNERS